MAELGNSYLGLPNYYSVYGTKSISSPCCPKHRITNPNRLFQSIHHFFVESFSISWTYLKHLQHACSSQCHRASWLAAVPFGRSSLCPTCALLESPWHWQLSLCLVLWTVSVEDQTPLPWGKGRNTPLMMGNRERRTSLSESSCICLQTS